MENMKLKEEREEELSLEQKTPQFYA